MPAPGPLRRRRAAGSPAIRLRQPWPRRPCRPGRRRSSAPTSRYGLAARSNALDLEVRRRVSLPGAPGDQAQRGLPGLVAPARERAGPVRRHQPQVARRRRRADRQQRRQPRQHAGRRTASPAAVRPYGPSPPANRLRAVARHATGARARRCRPGPAITAGANEARSPCRRGDRADRLAHQHAAVGGGHRVERRDRDLELAVGVLGVQLLDLDALLAQRGQQVAGVVADSSTSRVIPYAGPVQAGDELVGRPRRRDAHSTSIAILQRSARPRRRARPCAARTAAGRPGTARRPGCSGRPAPTPSRAGAASTVSRSRSGTRRRSPSGPPSTSRAGDRVVGDEHVEHRRHADAPAGGTVQPGQRAPP